MRPVKPVTMTATFSVMPEKQEADFWDALDDFLGAFARHRIAKEQAQPTTPVIPPSADVASAEKP